MTKENYIYGLAYNCPCLQRNEDCPLKEVNLLSFEKKVKWIQCLCVEKKEAIFAHHKACSNKENRSTPTCKVFHAACGFDR